MAKVWKVLALLLVITALVWLTTLWRWQSSQVNPDATQLLVHLAVLPLVLTAALLASIWGVKRLRTYANAPTVAPVPAIATAAPSAAATGPVASRPVPLRVLAAAACVRAGDTWQDAQSSIASGSCKAELDAVMKDEDGIAVFTAPIADLLTESVAEALEEIGTSRREKLPAEALQHKPPPEMLRALASLEHVFDRMAGDLETQWPALSVPLPSARTSSTPAPLPPTVSVRVGIPARWPVPAQQLATAWLGELFAPHLDAGLRAAGQSPAMARTASAAVQLHVHPVESAEAFWLLMEQQLQQWQREEQPGLLWALAADSLVGDEAVEQMSASQELFSGRRQQGRVPGEAAGGVLIASHAWSPAADTPPPLAMVHKASVARRDKSADASGRITSTALIQAVDDTLHGTGLDAAQIQSLTTDADHRASRTAEVYETVLARMPHLEPSEHALRLGLGCGDVGIARLIACAAMAATRVHESESPGLVLGAQTAFDRLAVLLAPATPPAASPDTALAA